MSYLEPKSGGLVFDQPDIAAMRHALERAWEALAFARRSADGPDDGTRDRLARSIVEQAKQGERNPDVLSCAALRELPPRTAYWVEPTGASRTENERQVA